MGKSELRVDLVIIELMCPWCHGTFRLRLGRGPHRCPSCQAEFTNEQLINALKSWRT